MTKEAFAKKYYPLAKFAGDKYGINPIVILAQGAHESAWGDSYGAKNRRNFFGIISSGKPNKYWNGAKSTSTASGLSFRVYNSDQDSFLDFARLISDNDMYNNAQAVSNDTAKYAHAISYSPYISETNGDNRPAYEKAVKSNSEFFKKVLGVTISQEIEKKK